MHLYKNFFRLLRNNKTGIIIYGSIMIVMIISLISVSSAVGNTADLNYSKSFNISYSDKDNSAFSQGLIETLSKNNKVTDMSGSSEGRIQDMVFFTMSDMHLIIENGEVSYLTTFKDNGNTYMLTNTIDRYKNTYDAYILMGCDESEAALKAGEIITDDTEITIASSKNAAVSGSDIIVFYLNQFYGYLAIGFMCLGIGHTVIANNDKLINDRVDASPLNRKKISISNTLGIATCGMFLWIFILILNIILGAGSSVISDHFPVVAVNTLLATLLACTIAALLTSFNISSNTLSMVTNIISLGMSFLCGVFVSQSLLSEDLLKFSRFLPLYWNVYVNNMTNSILSYISYDQDKLLLSFGIQLLFAAALAVMAAIVKSVSSGKTSV